jgi:hypothetical protein
MFRDWLPTRSILASMALSSILTGQTSLQAQTRPDDFLKRVEAENNVARQKLEAVVQETLASAQLLAETSRPRAIDRLRKLLNEIENEPAITPARRQEISNLLNGKIRQLENPNSIVKTVSSGKPRQTTKEKLDFLKGIEKERDEIRRSIDTIAALEKNGSEAQARKEADALVKRFPDNPAALAFEQKATMADLIKEARILLAQQQEGYLLAMRDVDKAMVLPKGDLEYDTIRKGYFKEISAKRMTTQLTEKEKRILQALDSDVTISLQGRPFDEVIQLMSDKIGHPILAEKLSLTDAGVDSSTPVTVNLKGVSARTALRKILQDQGLTFVVKNESIQVVTAEKAKQMMVTRVYYMGDVLRGGNVPWLNPNVYGLAAAQIEGAAIIDNANQLLRQIESSIDPLSWRKEGGGSTITFHYPSLSFIVRAPTEVHMKLSSHLGAGGR